MAKMFKALIKLSIILLILATAFGIGYSLYEDATYHLSYSATIKKYADEFQIDPYLVAAVINVESDFDSEAVSHKDARGLMQIGEGTGEWAARELEIEGYNQDMLYDPEINIRIGSWYLNNLSKEFNGNVELMLAAYNGGSGNVNKWLKDEKYSKDGTSLYHIPFKETRLYVEKVLRIREEYKDRYGGVFENPTGEDDRKVHFVTRIKKLVKDIF